MHRESCINYGPRLDSEKPFALCAVTLIQARTALVDVTEVNRVSAHIYSPRSLMKRKVMGECLNFSRKMAYCSRCGRSFRVDLARASWRPSTLGRRYRFPCHRALALTSGAIEAIPDYSMSDSCQQGIGRRKGLSAFPALPSQTDFSPSTSFGLPNR